MVSVLDTNTVDKFSSLITFTIKAKIDKIDFPLADSSKVKINIICHKDEELISNQIKSANLTYFKDDNTNNKYFFAPFTCRNAFCCNDIEYQVVKSNVTGETYSNFSAIGNMTRYGTK